MQMKTINLTIIGDCACSTTRTYLAYLHRAGLRPKNLWLVNFGPASTGLKLARKFLGWRRADRMLGQRNSPSQATDSKAAIFSAQLQTEAQLKVVEFYNEWHPAALADKLEYFSATDFSDPLLQRRMLEAADTAFLYTNGGIVPASLLANPKIRILHIHPGIVPEMRGSDCLLWSALLRQRIGVSCFYMGSGIDDGAVIAQQEFELPKLPSLKPFLSPKVEEQAYKALLFSIDPHYRAKLLVQVLEKESSADLRKLTTRVQASPLRPAYLWMHPRLRLKTMQESFL